MEFSNISLKIASANSKMDRGGSEKSHTTSPIDYLNIDKFD